MSHIMLEKLIPNILSTQMETIWIDELMVASLEIDLLD